VEVVGGIVLLAGLLFVGWLWNKGKEAAWKAANQKVLMRRAHRQGQSAVSEALAFVTAASPAQVVAQIRGFGWPERAESAVLTNLYVQSITEREVVFASGNRLAHSFRSRLTLEVAEGRTSGVYRVIEWKEGDGIVGDFTQMQVIADRLRSAVRSIDPTVSFTTTIDAA
jgi:hypothetical protein